MPCERLGEAGVRGEVVGPVDDGEDAAPRVLPGRIGGLGGRHPALHHALHGRHERPPLRRPDPGCAEQTADGDGRLGRGARIVEDRGDDPDRHGVGRPAVGHQCHQHRRHPTDGVGEPGEESGAFVGRQSPEAHRSRPLRPLEQAAGVGRVVEPEARGEQRPNGHVEREHGPAAPPSGRRLGGEQALHQPVVLPDPLVQVGGAEPALHDRGQVDGHGAAPDGVPAHVPTELLVVERVDDDQKVVAAPHPVGEPGVDDTEHGLPVDDMRGTAVDLHDGLLARRVPAVDEQEAPVAEARELVADDGLDHPGVQLGGGHVAQPCSSGSSGRQISSNRPAGWRCTSRRSSSRTASS